MSEEKKAASEQTSAPPVRHWAIDAARSTIEFQVPNLWGMATVKGHFSKFEGMYTISQDQQALELSIDASSLNTRNGRRDKHLRSSAFFDVEAHPSIRFTAADVRAAGNGELRVRGELESAGRKVPLSFPASVRQFDDAVEVEATVPIDHRLLGMTWNFLAMVRTPATAHVKAHLKPSGPDGAASPATSL